MPDSLCSVRDQDPRMDTWWENSPGAAFSPPTMALPPVLGLSSWGASPLEEQPMRQAASMVEVVRIVCSVLGEEGPSLGTEP